MITSLDASLPEAPTLPANHSPISVSAPRELTPKIPIEPLPGRIYARLNPPPRRTEGGLWLPQRCREKHDQHGTQIGVVLAIGPDVNLNIAVGDTIIVANKWAGRDIGGTDANGGIWPDFDWCGEPIVLTVFVEEDVVAKVVDNAE